MVDAASLDTGWDFWVLALLVALLLPGAMPANAGTEPPRGKMLFAARLAAEGAR
jgi:hypothetical protein